MDKDKPVACMWRTAYALSLIVIWEDNVAHAFIINDQSGLVEIIVKIYKK